MTVFSDLITRGYFPGGLPPPFETVSLRRVLRTFPTLVDNCPKAKLDIYYLARPGRARRRLAIPNPIVYIGLSKFLAAHWIELKRLNSRSPISLSKMTRSKSRAIGWARSHADLPKFRSKLRRFAKYMFQTDISRFYGSTYTHVIPWAVHGKAKAKADHSHSLWGNELDTWVRKGQDNQTFGIPIGPDTSFVIAETILSAIDDVLCRRMPEFSGVRHVDDYEAGFPDRSTAEEAYRLLEELLGEYELELNSTKTQILELPGRVTETWAAELTAMRIRRSVKGQETDILHFFDRMLELSKLNPLDSVVKYGLGRMRNTPIAKRNWEVYQDLLLQCIAVEVDTIEYVLREFLKYRRRGRVLDISAIGKGVNLHIVEHSRRGNHSEVAWALWALIELGIHLTFEAREAALKLGCSPVHLLLLDMENRNLCTKGTARLIWPERITSDDLYGSNWLAIYEANVKGWVSRYRNRSDYVANDQFFSILKTHNVSFYNLSNTVAPPRAAPAPGVGDGEAY